MADSLVQVIRWLKEHETAAYLLATVLVYLCWNVSRRPPPSNRALLVLWRIAELVTFLPWDRWFGRPVVPGSVWPPLEEEDQRVTQPPSPPCGPHPP